MEYKKTQINEFLKERRVNIDAAKAAEKLNPQKGFVIIVDPEDEVICDRCNAEITEEFVHTTDWGAFCPECRETNEKDS